MLPDPTASRTAHHPASDPLRRLIQLRWGVIALVLLLMLVAQGLLGIRLPWWPLLATLALLAALNVQAQRELAHAQTQGGSRELYRQLIIDLLGLGTLLFFSGGVTNPMIALLLPPVAIAALLLPAHQVWLIGGLATALYSLLLSVFLPLHLDNPTLATQLHLIGMWLSFVVSASLVAWLIMRMTARIRERDAELARIRERTLRDQHIMALGTLAAGAAHELGTPLASMAVLTGELRHETDLSPAVQADLALLQQQIARCKQIISDLTQRAGSTRLESTQPVAVDDWLEAIRQRWHASHPQAQSQLQRESASPAPRVLADPRLEQAINNLLDNADRLSGQRAITLHLGWTAQHIQIDIRDQGPGFPANVLALAGRQASSPHEEGQGIGLMLTRAAIEQLGGDMRLRNLGTGGAEVSLRLPRTDS